MRLLSVLPMLGGLALAGCDHDAEVQADNASAAEVAEKVRGAQADIRLRPGRWETNFQVDELEAPSLSAATAEQMRAALTGQAFAACLSPEEANKPAADLFVGKDIGKQCRYEKFTMGGGRISAVLRCSGGQGEVRLRMNGSYGPNEWRITQEMDSGAAGQAMRMTMRVAARRTGECQGNEAA